MLLQIEIKWEELIFVYIFGKNGKMSLYFIADVSA